MTERAFYRVSRDPDDAPLRDYLLHGYEERRDFYKAVQRLLQRWSGRVGECVGERHGFLLLRFYDTPGGRPDEAWLPQYLLQPADPPEYLPRESTSSEECAAELDGAFGF